MANRFSFSRSSDPSPHGHWFRIGTIEVTTSVLFVFVSALFIVTFAFSRGLHVLLALDPDLVLRGYVWQLVTWPFSQLGLSIWTVVALALIWMFGSELEGQIGRFKFGGFLLGSTIALAVLGVGLGLALGRTGAPVLFGPQLLQFVVLMVYVAEYPDRRFFFNIPGWVIGAVLLGIQVITLLGYRDWFGLLHLLIGLAVCAAIARSMGLLQESAVMARVPKPAPKVRKPKGATRVVQGPWAANPSGDQEALDALLDKIHAQGIDSLSAKEKKQLLVLRERLRGN